MDKDVLSRNKTAVAEKVKESAVSVLPIILIVTLLCFSISPIQTDLMLNFLIGTVMVVFGMGFFSLGAEASMIPIGNKIGTALTKSKKLSMILIFSFALGFAVTVAEPDLQVLAETVPHISNGALLVTVGIGVGFFLTICMVRILTGIKLRWLLIVFYAVLFALAAFTDADFLSIAFDSGGVTTGPMTVPFILAFGVGISNIRSDRKAEADSFGLVSLCSIGPILAVLILGFFYSDSEAVAGIAGFAEKPSGIVHFVFRRIRQILQIQQEGDTFGSILLRFAFGPERIDQPVFRRKRRAGEDISYEQQCPQKFFHGGKGL